MFNLQNAAIKVGRSTGMRFQFTVGTKKADGSDIRVVEVNIVALNVADSWGLIGDAVCEFMNGPDGRVVYAVMQS